MRKDALILIKYFCYGLLGLLLIFKLYTHQYFLSLILAIIYLIILLKRKITLPTIVMILGSIFGSVGEIIETHFHVWSYSVATPLGIPAWLPFAWGLAVYVIFQISQIFVQSLKA